MWYAILSEDHPNSLENRLAARPAHAQRLQDLQSQGRLLLAGPHPMIESEDPGAAGFSGSLVVAEFDSLASAHSWANDDPYVTEGIYAKVVIKPFKQTFPN
ncbi:YciI family protein [Reinekea sp.]|uniref:YciI family protein n=1 Tax=Reinekea sp. TaxID=1970455 RepID=UPI00257FA574|nr:YciI family protein [Reinekea sp.]